MMYNITEYDYERIEFHKNINHDSFKIKTGMYSGTIITYGEIAIHEQLDGSPPKLKFQYQIDHTPLDANTLKDEYEFNTYVGDMLTHIIEKALEENNFAIGELPNGTKSTNNNFEESN